MVFFGWKPICVFLAAFLLLGRLAHSLEFDSLLDLELGDLSNLKVVSTSKREETLAQTPSMVSVITEDEIKLLGFHTTQQVMEYVTGLSSLNGEGNVFTTTTIMGNTQVNYNTNTLLLVDGKSLVSPYHGSFDFAAVPLSSIARIEVVKGSHSVLYGTNAINAVINVITKRQAGSKSNYASVGAGGLRQANSSFSLVSEDQSLSLHMDVVRTGGEDLDLVDESARTLSMNPNTDVVNAIVQYQRDCIEGHVQGFRRTLNNHRTKGFVDRQENQEQGLLFSLGCRYSLSENHSVYAALNYYDWSLDKDFFKFASGDEFRWAYQAFSRSAVVEYDLDDSLYGITLGVTTSENNARRYKEDKGSYDIGASNDITRDTAVYANGQYQMVEATRLYAGVRYYQSIFYDATQEGNVELDNTSTRLALVHSLIPGHYLKAIYGEAFRVPTYFEKQVSSATVVGNANLKPEKSQSTSIVYAYAREDLSLELALYENSLKDRITRVPTDADPSIFQNANVGQADFMGFEADAKFSLSARLKGFAGLAYVETDDIENYYPWMFSGAVGYELANRQSTAVSFKYLDQWGGARDYLLVNPSYSYRLATGLSYRLGVHNLLDQNRELPEIARQKDSVPTIPVAHRRTVFLSIRFDF